MNILKRLMNVVTVSWLLWFSLYLFVIVEDSYSYDNFFERIAVGAGVPSFAIPTFFGWLIIIVINYIIFHKVTLWNKT